MAGGDITLEKTMPCNPEAERAILGACLLDEGAVWTATGHLEAEDFYDQGHRVIFRAMAVSRIPPAALTPISLPTTYRIKVTSSTVAPDGPKPVDVFTKSAPASLHIRQAFIFSSVVR